MDKISLLQSRRNALLQAGEAVRKSVSTLIDADSFVETDSFSFSGNEFYGENAEGEGVVTGLATLEDTPVAIVALNSAVLSGGLTLAGCKKIVKCLEKAENASAPVVYLLSSQGVVAGEGVNVLEGVAEVVAKMDELKGYVPQFAVVLGDVLGSASLFVAEADYAYYLKDSCVSYASPLVIAAKSNLSADKAKIGGAVATEYNNLATFTVESLEEVKDSIANILNVLPAYGGELLETGDDLNRAFPALNEKACAKCLQEAVFDKDYCIELGKGYAPEVVTAIGRIGGYSAAAIIFNGENGVALTKENVYKVKEFLYYCDDNDLPVITFVNTLGIEENTKVSNSTVLKEITNLVNALKTEMPRINVVYGKAIGLGYTLFASKAFGADYTYAFANAQIGLFNSEVGARLEIAGSEEKIDAAMERYTEETMDAFNAARNGYIDNVIEPQFVRQYLIAAIQTLI